MPAPLAYEFNFRDQPWGIVLEWFSNITHLPFVANIKPTGTFTFITPRVPARNETGLYTVPEILDILNESLMQQKLLLVRRPNDLTLISTDEKIDPSLFRPVRIDELPQLARTDLVSIRYQLKWQRSNFAVNAARHWLTPLGDVAIDESTNSLVLRDRAISLRLLVPALDEYERQAKDPPRAQPTPEPAASPVPQTKESKAERKFTIEFRDQPWGNVFEWLTEITGLPVIANTKPTGTLTFVPSNPRANGQPRQYTISEIIDILNDALMQQKFLLVRRSNNFMLAPTDEKIDPSLYPVVRIDELSLRGRTELVTVHYKLERLRAPEVVTDVKKMLGPLGSASFQGRTNSVIVSDAAGNVQRIVKMLAELDQESGGLPPGPSGGADGATPELPISPITDRPATEFVVNRPAREFAAGANQSMLDAALLPNSDWLITTNSDGTAKMWRLSERTEVRTFTLMVQGHGWCPLAVSKDGRFAAVAGSDKVIRVSHAATGKFDQLLRGHDEHVWSLAFTADGKRLICGSESRRPGEQKGEICVWDVASGELLQKKPTTGIRSLALAANNKSLFCISSSGTSIEMEIRDGVVGKDIRSVLNPRRGFKVAADPTGKLVAFACGEDGRVIFWNAQNGGPSGGENVGNFFAHKKPVTALSFSSDGAMLLTGSLDGEVRYWDVSNPSHSRCIATFSPPPSAACAWACLFTPDNKQIITAHQDGIVRFWDIESAGGSADPSKPPANPVPPRPAAKTTHLDGQTHATLAAEAPIALLWRTDGPDKDFLRIWEVGAETEQTRLKLQFLATAIKKGQSSVPLVALSADGKFAAFTIGDMLNVWDNATGKKLIGSTVHAGEICALTFGARGKLVATAGKTDEQVRVWDVASGNEVRQFRGFTSPATVLAFSPDGTKLLTSDGSIMRVFAITTGEEIDHRVPVGRAVTTATFMSDGRIAAAAGDTMLIWRPEAGQSVRRISFGGETTIVAIIPVAHGRGLVTADKGGFVRLWNPADGRQVRQFGLPGSIGSLRVAADEKSFTAVLPNTATGTTIITLDADLSVKPE